MKEFHMIVVDNDKKEIIGNVTDWHFYSRSISVHIEKNGIDHSFKADNIDELLEKAKERNIIIYYMIGGVRIPVNRITHNKSHYLYHVSWYNLTPAEAVIFSGLYETTYQSECWMSIQQLDEILTSFGFKSTSLQTLLTKIRQKIAYTNFHIQNKNKKGYRLIDTGSIPKDELLLKETQTNQDYFIIHRDKFLNYLLENSAFFIDSVATQVTGSQILHGWQGLTRTEAEIYFELVKFRNDWVSIDQLIALPWATRYENKSDLRKKYLQNFIGRIRKKVDNVGEVILTEYGNGYCLI